MNNGAVTASFRSSHLPVLQYWRAPLFIKSSPMCDAHHGFTEAETHGFSAGRSESRSRRYFRPDSTSWMGGAGPEDLSEANPTQDILSDIDVGRGHKDKLHLDINIRSFRMLLRRA